VCLGVTGIRLTKRVYPEVKYILFHVALKIASTSMDKMNMPKTPCSMISEKSLDTFMSYLISKYSLLAQDSAQRLALPAGGWDEITPFYRNQLQATQSA
jgi:hypothetical protein